VIKLITVGIHNIQAQNNTMVLNHTYRGELKLTFQSLLVTSCTNSFNFQQLYALSALYFSQNKQRILPLYTIVFFLYSWFRAS